MEVNDLGSPRRPEDVPIFKWPVRDEGGPLQGAIRIDPLNPRDPQTP